MLVRKTSADSSIRWSTAKPISCWMSSAMDRFPRLASARERFTPPRSVPIPWRGQAAVGIARRRFDVHDVGAPVGEQCPRDRDEDPLCELDDPDAVESLFGHVGQARERTASRGEDHDGDDPVGAGLVDVVVRPTSVTIARALASRRPRRCSP